MPLLGGGTTYLSNLCLVILILTSLGKVVQNNYEEPFEISGGPLGSLWEP
jgi:hypothetical protein